MLCMLVGYSKTYCQVQDQIERTWYNEEQSAKIKIYKSADDKYYGKIIWLKVPTIDGKSKTDYRNPDKNHKNVLLNGLVILKGFDKHGDKSYEDGTIYDPKNGKTYSCIITYRGNKLDVRGYIGFSLLGRTTKWVLAE